MLLLAAVAVVATAARQVPGGGQMELVDAVEVKAAELPADIGDAVRDQKNFLYGGVGGFAGMGGYS